MCVAVLSPGCRTAAPPAEAAPTPAATAGAADTTPADVRFLRDMIGHHAQALVMTALVPARTAQPDLRLLAERIDVSQRDEIAMMGQLLRKRGVTPPSIEHAAHGMMDHMPGMLTEAELTRLREARGPDFDQLFLESMIRHHEGALTMVARLLASRGGTADTEIYRLAADVDADQRAEIARMRGLLTR
ncbi:MAG TPA: DUF305 domain-containing protein [Gemmatimonadaceae bacterium]|nr:DUF305 domain-containing protein [Gemmatimonadaceae bacterium]